MSAFTKSMVIGIAAGGICAALVWAIFGRNSIEPMEAFQMAFIGSLISSLWKVTHEGENE